jgi:hypothetical protein
MPDGINCIGVKANGATTNIEVHRAVIWDTSNEDYVKYPTAAGQMPAGITTELVDHDGQHTSIQTTGVAKCEAASAISVGDRVMVADTAGKIATAVATYSTDLGVADTDVLWTAQAPDWAGQRGEDITIEYRDPGANSASLSVVVEGTAIIVNLATDGGGAITSTADLIKAAVAALAEAAAMVVGTDVGTDDGSGVVTAMAAKRLSGGFGFGAAIEAAAAATEYIDVQLGLLG